MIALAHVVMVCPSCDVPSTPDRFTLFPPKTFTCGMVGHSFGQHCFSTTRRTKHQDTTRWVDSNLLVQVKVGQGQLYCLPHFLFLDVHASNVCVRHVGFLIYNQSQMKYEMLVSH